MKRCPTCKTEKHESEFARDKSKRDGLHSQCKECKRAHCEANREKKSERYRAYYEANREKIAERKRDYSHAYYEANRERRLEYQRAYREANREKNISYEQNRTRGATDSYIKKLIALKLKISTTKVPPQLVELKRQHLTLHRAVRNLEGAISEKRNQDHRPTARHAGRRGQASDGR